MASQSLKLGNIKPENATFFMCDIQEKFRPVIKYFKEILEIAEKLVCLYSLASVTLTLYSTFMVISWNIRPYSGSDSVGIFSLEYWTGTDQVVWILLGGQYLFYIYTKTGVIYFYSIRNALYITLPVYLSKHNWENLPLTIKGHDFVKCYISLFCT